MLATVYGVLSVDFQGLRFAQKEANMGREAAGRRGTAELVRLQEHQQKLNDALRVLFSLLEQYAPPWYTQDHHDQAEAALASVPRPRTGC